MKYMYQANALKRQASLQQWTATVLECRSSGKSVKLWCEQHSIALSTYYTWEGRVLAAQQYTTEALATSEPQSHSPVFAQVPTAVQQQCVKPVANDEVVVRLHIGKAEVDILSGASSDVIRTICEVLKYAE